MDPKFDMKPNPDRDHLRLLSIFHYVLAAVTAVFSLFPIFHLIIGLLMVSDTIHPGDQHSEVPVAIIGWMFVIIPAFMILAGLACSAVIALAGSRLARYSSYTFCLVVAAIECVFFPFGTVLGVFTIIVLNRPSVKELFAAYAT